MVCILLDAAKHPRPRIESLSDLVFGLALSIGTISLITRIPRSPGDIVFDVVQFGFSFLVLISVWISYTSIMSVLPVEDRTVTILNVVMLFLVAIEPYLFYLNVIFDLSGHELLLDYASTIYAIDMAGLFAILAIHASVDQGREKSTAQRFAEQVQEYQKSPFGFSRVFRIDRSTDILVSENRGDAFEILPLACALGLVLNQTCRAITSAWSRVMGCEGVWSCRYN